MELPVAPSSPAALDGFFSESAWTSQCDFCLSARTDMSTPPMKNTATNTMVANGTAHRPGAQALAADAALAAFAEPQARQDEVATLLAAEETAFAGSLAPAAAPATA